MEVPEGSATDRRQWAFKLAKEIFSERGERNGKETMICSRCSHLPVEMRGTDWQLPLAGTTKAKVHLAAYCPGLDAEDAVDGALQHALLISLSESSMTSKKARVAWDNAWLKENGGFPPQGKSDKKRAEPNIGGLFQPPIMPARPEEASEGGGGAGEQALASAGPCTEERRARINHLIAKVIHGCSIPSDVVEDADFLQLIKELDYSYFCTGVPKQQWIETLGLKGVYQELKAQQGSSSSARGGKKRKAVQVSP